MSSQYEIGDAVPLTWAITVAGVATNATVVLTLTAPDGTTSTPAVSNPTTGNYTATVTPTLNGTYSARWVATGAVAAAETEQFDVGSNYTTLVELKSSLGITDTDDDVKLVKAIRAASRAIDRMTSTHFFAVTEARLFEPSNCGDVWVDRFTDATGLVVKTGTDGTYTTTVLATDVVLWPHNAPKKGGAYERLLIPTNALSTGYARPTVQVTATWGWTPVPEDVSRACLLKAARLYRRKDSPEGIAGSSEFGVVRISRYEDPDVLMLLAPYTPIAVA